MSGIVAIVGHDRSQSISQEEIEQLIDAYEAVRGSGKGHQARADDFCLLAKIDTENSSRPGIEVDNGSWAASTGAAFNSNSLLGVNPRDLDGQFSLFAYDASSGRVTVASDALGLHALYKSDQPGRTYFSTSALALAKHLQARPNELGLKAFLASGYHFGTLTHWEGIERIDPAQEFSFGPDGTSVTRYWQPRRDDDTTRLDFKATVAHCTERAVGVLRSYLADDGPVWSDLTGGFDSRLLNLLLGRAGVDFATTTRDTPTEEDIPVARDVARSAGWDWLHTSLPDNWHEVLVDVIPAALGWADANLEVLQLSRVLWPHEALGRLRPKLLSSGGGEHFQFAAWKSEFLRAGRSNQVSFDNFVNMRMIKPIDASVFAVDPTPEVRADFVARLRGRVEPYSEELNTTQLDLLYAYKSMGHFGAYASSDEAFINAQVPFYFKPIFESAFSANYRYRNNHRLLRHMIQDLSPKLAAMQTTRGGPAQPWRPSNVHRFLPYYAQLAQKAVNKLSHKALGRTLWATAPPIWAWEHLATNAVLDHLGTGQPFVHENLRSAKLYNGARLNEFLKQARAKDFAQSPLLGRIITVELALREVGTDL